MPKTRLQKEETVTNITEKLGRAKSVVFADYKGMTMKQLSDLRKKLREVSSEFSVTKNTLLKLALLNSKFRFSSENSQERTILNSNFEGPIATLFAYDDEITPIKLLVKTLKDNNIGMVKGGLLGQEALDASKVNQLATLPSKDELRGKTVGVLVAPLQGIVSVLQGNLRNLVYALNQIKISKGGEF